jgi:putative FmdB family regulatory protein
MPAYTYRCQSCSATFKIKQSFSDKQLLRCPKCHRITVRRIPQVPALIFKGSGWYSTDHRSSATLSKKNDHAEISTSEKNIA